MIRIGDSCCLSLDMVTPQARVVETRRFYNHPSQWYEIAKKCINEKKFIIVTPCIAHIDFEGVPNEAVWRGTIEDTVIKLLALGANKNNSRIDIINEPMKFVSKEVYTNLINIAYSQVNKRVPVGAGCEEFITAMAKGDMYNYICQNANFDVLVVHIQGSCDTPANTQKWCEWAYSLSQRYNKPIDCNEAFYADIATSKGWNLLNTQLYWAEKIGCPNFCNVFNNLDKKAFNHNTDKWNFLAFKINGILRSNYWQQWKELMNSKAPNPNIIELEIEDDMKLERYYYRLKTTYDRDKTKAGVKFIQTVVGAVVDGKWGTETDELLKAYQRENDLVDDAIVGPLTFRMMMKTNRDAYIDLQYFTSTGDW